MTVRTKEEIVLVLQRVITEIKIQQSLWQTRILPERLILQANKTLEDAREELATLDEW